MDHWWRTSISCDRITFDRDLRKIRNHYISQSKVGGVDHRALLRGFLENPTFSDVTVIIGEEAKVFKLHRIILAANSDYFVGALNEAFTEGKSRQITIPHINSDVFKRVIEYFYTRSLGFTDEDPLDWNLIAALYQAADYLLAPILKQEVTLYLAKKIVDFNFVKYIERNPEAEGKNDSAQIV
ncbi:kelch-like [Orbilia oligospora]|nr:kelch-like [Orbilia oligospora]